MRGLAAHRNNFLRRQQRAIRRTPAYKLWFRIGPAQRLRLYPADVKGLFRADEQRNIIAHQGAVTVYKTFETAVMVTMAMAED